MIYQIYSIGGNLYHHGIRGQRWGHRNGPPYPLNASAKSYAEGNKQGSSHRGILGSNPTKDKRTILREKKRVAKYKLRGAKDALKYEKYNTKKQKNDTDVNRKITMDYFFMTRGERPSNYSNEKEAWEKHKNTETKIKDRQKRILERDNKNARKYHNENAKVEKKVAKYIKKYGTTNLNDLDSYKLRRMEAKTQKILAKIAKEKTKQDKLKRQMINYHNAQTDLEYYIEPEKLKKYTGRSSPL